MRQFRNAVDLFFAGQPAGGGAKQLGERLGPHRMSAQPEKVFGRAAGKIDTAAAKRQFFVGRGQQRNRGDRCVGQHPGVLASFAIEQRKFQWPERRRHASQAAGHDRVAVFLRDRKRAQRDVRRLKLVAGPRRSARSDDALVSDERGRIALMSAVKFCVRHLGQLADLRQRFTTAAIGGPHDQFVEPFEHVVQHLRFAAPPRRDARHRQRLAEQRLGKAWQERAKDRRLDQAAARRIGDRDIAGPRDLQQTGGSLRAGVANFERIEMLAVRSPQREH